MNKKGFTTVELIVSFIVIVIILGSLVGFTINYRDRVKLEQIKSSLIDFKNTITKAVYDDIIDNNIKSMEYCVGYDNCVNLIDSENNSHTLKIFYESKDGNDNYQSYLSYNNIKYELPDSDINKYQINNEKIVVSEKASDFDSFELKSYNNSLYNLKITFSHYMLKDNFEILININ